MSGRTQEGPERRAPRPAIEPRRVRFDWSRSGVHLFPDDPFASDVINVLHLLLPEGERWFCRVYRDAEPLVTDPALAEDVRRFVRQEAMHASAHARLVDHFASHGLDTKGFTDEITFLFRRLLGDAPFGIRLLEERAGRPWLVFRVGAIAAIEHFTCVLGAWVLEADALDAPGADATMLDLLRWPGAEAVEHRAVAFELYQHLSGDRGMRVVHIALVTPILIALWIRGARFLFRVDPAMRDAPRTTVLADLRSYTRVAESTRRLPHPRLLGRAVRRYLARDYHPDREASLGPALDYLGRSPAVAAYRGTTP